MNPVADAPPLATLTLDGPIVPKARPRVTRTGHAFMPQSYRQWKADAIAALAQQWGGRDALGALGSPVAVVIWLEGKHRRSGDADNTAGAILDALVQAGVLAGDNLVAVPRIAVILKHGPTPPKATIAISPIPREAA